MSAAERMGARAVALAVVALAAWLSLTPRPPSLPGAPAGTDLLVHLVMHGGAAFCLLRGWAGAMPAALALAISLEAGQALVPGRDVFAGDLAMNLSGAALGAIAWALVGDRLAGRRT